MGTGLGCGQDRAIKAATEAISSPLLEDITIDGATGIIINITGNESLTMHETNEAVTLIMEAADEDAEIIFGTVIDESLDDEIKVTVIATGLGGEEHLTTEKVQAKKETEVEEITKTEDTSVVEEKENLERFLAVEEDKIAAKKELEEPEVEKSVINEPTSVYKKEAAEKKPLNQNASRAKTIAEKLGFVSYDEDELDRPTYLRMTNDDSSSPELR